MLANLHSGARRRLFVVGRREGRKHALSLLRSGNELSKVVTLDSESSQSHTVSFFFGGER